MTERSETRPTAGPTAGASHGEVTVIRTGVANLASVAAGLARLGLRTRVTTSTKDVAQAQRVVLPGVGAFGAGMQMLRRYGLVAPLRQRIAEGRPTLTICLGLQLLSQASEEDPGVEGLSVLATTAGRFPNTVRVPQLGWNAIEPDPACRLLQPMHAYFANSYRLVECPDGWSAAWAEYGGRFVAALERGPILGCQFHLELSGKAGLALLERWLDAASA